MTAGGQADHGSKQDAGRQAGAGRLGGLLQDLALTQYRVRTAELPDDDVNSTDDMQDDDGGDKGPTTS